MVEGLYSVREMMKENSQRDYDSGDKRTKLVGYRVKQSQDGGSNYSGGVIYNPNRFISPSNPIERGRMPDFMGELPKGLEGFAYTRARNYSLIGWSEKYNEKLSHVRSYPTVKDVGERSASILKFEPMDFSFDDAEKDTEEMEVPKLEFER